MRKLKDVEVLALDLATVEELNFHLNKLACEGWLIGDLFHERDSFFQSFKVIAWREPKKIGVKDVEETKAKRI